MKRLFGILVLAVVGGQANAAETSDAQVFLVELAGFNQSSLSAQNVVFDVELRERGTTPARIEQAVVVLADGGLNVRRSGIDEPYATCTRTTDGWSVSTSMAGGTYFIGHRVDMRARDCDADSCLIDVDATLSVDLGLRSEDRHGCVHETPNIALLQARIAERAGFMKPIRVDLGTDGELVVTVRASEAERSH